MKKKLAIVISLFLLLVTAPVLFGEDVKELKVSREKTVVECNWGTKAGEVGKLEFASEPTAIVESINPIAVDKSGNVYVGDSINRRIEKFDLNGRFLTEYKISDNVMTYIESVSVGLNGDVYALTNNELLIHFLPNGKVNSILDLKQFGILKRDDQGKVVLDKRYGFSGYHHKLYIDSNQDIFVLAGDLFKLSRKGEIIKRWGPDVFDFIIEPFEIMTIFYYGSKFEQYNSKYNLINKGLLNENGKFTGRQWSLIRGPEYVDAAGCVFGFTESKDNFLGKYCNKEKLLYRLPLKQDDLISEQWTVDSQGNVYYTDSQGKNFKVKMLSNFFEKKEAPSK